MRIGETLVIEGIEYELTETTCGVPKLHEVDVHYKYGSHFKIVNGCIETPVILAAIDNDYMYVLVNMKDGTYYHNHIRGNSTSVRFSKLKELVSSNGTLVPIDIREASRLME